MIITTCISVVIITMPLCYISFAAGVMMGRKSALATVEEKIKILEQKLKSGGDYGKKTK